MDGTSLMVDRYRGYSKTDAMGQLVVPPFLDNI
jgi:hypothetical protein